jgi:hypothetical protein
VGVFGTYADQDPLALEVDILDRELVGQRHLGRFAAIGDNKKLFGGNWGLETSLSYFSGLMAGKKTQHRAKLS